MAYCCSDFKGVAIEIKVLNSPQRRSTFNHQICVAWVDWTLEILLRVSGLQVLLSGGCLTLSAALWFSSLKTLLGFSFPFDFLSSLSPSFWRSEKSAEIYTRLRADSRIPFVSSPLLFSVAFRSLSSFLSLIRVNNERQTAVFCLGLKTNPCGC